MNKLFFYTKVAECEQSPVITACKTFRQILEQNNISFTLVDINNTVQKQLNKDTNGAGTLPYFVIRNDNNEVIYHFGPNDIELIVKTTYENIDSFKEQAVTEFKRILTEYSVI